MFDDEHFEVEKIILSGEKAKPLVLAAVGKPHLILVEDENGDYISNVTNGFDVSMVFKWIKKYAQSHKDNKEFQSFFADCLIELNKEL